jgi:hypothetical protein
VRSDRQQRRIDPAGERDDHRTHCGAGVDQPAAESLDIVHDVIHPHAPGPGVGSVRRMEARRTKSLTSATSCSLHGRIRWWTWGSNGRLNDHG